MDLSLGAQDITLQSRYLETGRPVLLGGVQAIVRLLLEQARSDRAAGRHTAGFVTGYRGSPLGGLDQELWRQEALLREHDVRFQPGLNEDLAATMVWGTQQIDAFAGKRVDGVFSLWYGKGPGVDRSTDAFRCANMIGTSPLGGALAVSGDDHAAHSSTFPHQTDQIFQSVMIPVLQPADVGEIVAFGLAGFALSRFSGSWVALKTIAETAEQTRTLILPTPAKYVLPEFPIPAHGLTIDNDLQWPAQRAEMERRVLEERLPAVHAWTAANALDRTIGAADAPIGIVTVGKAHHDVVHALARLGLAGDPRIAIRKVGLTWPLETDGMRRFAAGRRAILVVEEKRSFVEAQLRDALYNLPADERPPIGGKADLFGAPLVPAAGELSPDRLLPIVARFLRGVGLEIDVPAPRNDTPRPGNEAGLLLRAPTFCAGCPHNTSTTLPDGSHAMAGIGCHIMALDSTPATRTFSHMGGEGAAWAGMHTFSTMPHMFANMGDGTYQHSGLLAIRQAVAASVPITYKILYNDAVAMTGGQPAEGGPTVAQIARQVAAEGVARIAVVADDASRLPPAAELPAGATTHARDELDAVQRTLRDVAGVSVLIYDQVCATEKRRRRKRGSMAAAEVAVSINARVCENCGDCTAQSHCIAIEPVETDYGRKRRISPTSCNTDLSCLKGFCPSFVTARPVDKAKQTAPEAETWRAREDALAATLVDPVLPATDRPWRGLFAGIGGGGIITAGAIVAMAAHLDGREVSTLDFTGLAQKNGAVVAHVQIAEGPIDVVRIPENEASLLLAADLAVGASADVGGRCAGRAVAIGNLDLAPNAEFLSHRDLPIDAGLHRRAIERRVDREGSRFIHAAQLSERLFGTAQAMNTLLLGLAWQRGLLPVSHAALTRAIALNGTAVALNHRALLWGRLLAVRPELAGEILHDRTAPPTLDALIDARAEELVRYQGKRLARRYRALVAKAAARERTVAGAGAGAGGNGSERVTRAVAEGYFRVLAIKDEYEVARLHAAAEYGDDPVFHMAPPLLTRTDKATGRKRKIAIPGRVALPLFRALRHGRALRGTPLDPFGWQAERREERALIGEYERDVAAALDAMRPDTLDKAAQLAELPLDIRGFGPVKQASMAAAAPRREALRRAIDAPAPATLAVAAD